MPPRENRRTWDRRSYLEVGPSLAAADIALQRVGGLFEETVLDDVAYQPRIHAGRPGQRRRRTGWMAILEANRSERRVSAEGRRGEIGQLPVLLGNEPNA